MDALSFKLEQFEGPLDLMLHLISQHKLDILEIEISQVMDQYLEAIGQMQEEDMEIASSFLEMASRLVYIKTLSLLPKREKEQQELTRELTGQLLEYSLCQPEKLERDSTYKGVHSLAELMGAYLSAIGRGQRKLPPPEDVFRPIVRRHVVSVSSRIAYLLQRLYREKAIGFEKLFYHVEDRSELVATFLAVLELVKDKRILVSEDEQQTIVPVSA